MKIGLFWKTFLMLLVSFSLLFLVGDWYLYARFADRYVEENIEAMKAAILRSADNGTDDPLSASILAEVSSETQFIRIRDDAVFDRLGPDTLSEAEIVPFVIGLYDHADRVTEGNLTYVVTKNVDIYAVSYVYRYADNDYLLVMTRIQSLYNVDRVLDDVIVWQGAFLFAMIVLLSFLISRHVASPIRRIARYARSIAALDFDQRLILERKDEFRDLIGSLNEMAFNLRKSYADLADANLRLKGDIEFEQRQEAKKKQLIMTINHELRTPVSIIRGMVEGMMENVGRFKDRETYLKEVLGQIDEIERRTKDLTYTLRLEDLAKPGDHANLSTLAVTLAPVVELATQKKVTLSIELIDQEVAINPELLGILAANVLKNAVNYTTDRCATLRTHLEDGRCVLEVRNRGAIADQDLQMVFRPYYRANTATEGSGLGLFIVSRICEIHGMECKLYNDNGDVVFKTSLALWKMS